MADDTPGLYVPTASATELPPGIPSAEDLPRTTRPHNDLTVDDILHGRVRSSIAEPGAQDEGPSATVSPVAEERSAAATTAFTYVPPAPVADEDEDEEPGK